MAQRADEERPGSQPSLSLVVPIYNVEAYLRECLESVAQQTVEDFEVIMVDDGSTDSSGEIAAKWAARDPRFRLVTQQNGGLGHARNTGASQARGKYLAFLDSDDKVHRDSYHKMIDTLEKSGSDFATGNVHRFDSTGRTWQSPLYSGMAKTEIVGTHASKYHDLLRDHLAPNKVWRTSFWHGADLKFPVGVLYEDVPTTIPAHIKARAVDVVPVVATLWRVRDQGDFSITQNRGSDPRQLRDRVDGMLSVSNFIGKRSGQELKDAYDHLVLRRDLRWYVDLYHDVDAEYKEEIYTSISRFLAQASRNARRQTPAAMRIAYALLEMRADEDFAAYVALRRDGKVDQLPVAVENGRAVLNVDLPLKTKLATFVRDITEELRVASRTTRVDVVDKHLVIEGWAYIRRLPIEKPQEIKVTLRGRLRRIKAEVTYRRDDGAAAEVGALAEAIGSVAFTARVPLRRLQAWWRLGRPTQLAVNVSVTNGGVKATNRLAKPEVGPAERPVMAQLPNGNWLRVCWTRTGLSCRVRAERAVLEGVTSDDDALEFVMRTNEPASPSAKILLRRVGPCDSRSFPVEADPNDPTLCRARVSATDLSGLAGSEAENSAAEKKGAVVGWNVMYRPSTAQSWQRVLDPVGITGCALAAGDVEFVVQRAKSATIDVTVGAVAPMLTKVEWIDGGRLALRLEYVGEPTVTSVTLNARGRDDSATFQVTQSDTMITAELALGAVPLFGGTLPIRAGTWDLVVSTSEGEVPVRLGSGNFRDLPKATTHAGRTYTLTDRGQHNISLVVGSDLGPDERGSQNQDRLRTEIYPQAKTGLRDGVLYESYFAKQFSDSPRNIFEELLSREFPAEHLVVVRDQQVSVPSGAKPIVHRSREYYEALAQSRYVVSNTHLPACFERAAGQQVLQTWHGCGTKKMGLDMESVHFANKKYLDNLRNGEADNWDFMISPNPFSSPILKRAFAFRGRMLETGAPRNDIFYRSDRSDVAAQVKDRLGIAHDRKVILYAPTWRDDLYDGPGRYRMDLRFDLHQAAKTLGDEYAVVYRKHSNVVDRLPIDDGSVVDASDYPDIQELLLIADILVSDYSTLICDFVNTGRPMLFYTYDLANYRDKLRGFYIDYENDVPGPLITEEADLVAAIADADNIRKEYDAKYEKFAQRFCPWEDGGAAQRVVDAVFGEKG